MKTKFCLSFLTIVGLLFTASSTIAQTYQPSNRIPVADNTLGTQVSGGNNNFTITGGLNRGQNVFHSFQDFSVPTGGAATFINPAGNQSIITRVTGNLFSDINGIVNTQGANLFLINPNGIVFGTNAQLNVGKSFVGSTANGIDLVDAGGNSYRFGTNSNDAPLLTINPNALLTPARLILGGSNSIDRGIVNYGTIDTKNDSQYIGLIGGNVTLDGQYGGGKIVAPGGRVDLGGLNTAGTVSIDNNGLVSGGNGLSRSDVLLNNGAYVTVRANQILGTVNTFFNNSTSPGSSINISTNNLKILDSGSHSSTEFSAIDAGLQTDSGIKALPAGSININANGEISLNNSDVKNTIRTGAEGKIGNITINANSLTIFGTNNPSLLQGDDSTALAQISSVSAGQGDAEKITIDVKDKLSLDGRGVISSTIASTGVGNSKGIKINANELILSNLSTLESSTAQSAQVNGKGNAGDMDITTNRLSTANRSRISADTYGIGNGGNLTITADRLQTVDGGQISASTYGQGNAGKLTVDASSVEIDRESPSTNNRATLPTGLFAQVEPDGTGNAGDLTLTTKTLSVSSGGKVQAATFGKGNGGNLVIKADDMNVFDTPGFNNNQFTNINVGIGFDSERNVNSAQGKGGDLTIETGRLSVRNGAIISSDSKGIGVGGTLKINAKVIELQNQGVITTETLSGQGGIINLNVSDYILMHQNSQISATAGTAQQGGDGGNITIDTKFIIATPKENNDITANAYTGTGGKVQINAQSILGLQNRSQATRETNDITASSQFGSSGTVTLNTPDLDPNRGLSVLPTTTNDPSNQVNPNCSPKAIGNNSFTNIGRGGIPRTPQDPLNEEQITSNWVRLNPQDRLPSAPITPTSARIPQPFSARRYANGSAQGKPIVEAQGWRRESNGDIVLVAGSSPGALPRQPQPQSGCIDQ
jgi:filamentous hemagglutinin family protein